MQDAALVRAASKWRRSVIDAYDIISVSPLWKAMSSAQQKEESNGSATTNNTSSSSTGGGTRDISCTRSSSGSSITSSSTSGTCEEVLDLAVPAWEEFCAAVATVASRAFEFKVKGAGTQQLGLASSFSNILGSSLGLPRAEVPLQKETTEAAV